MTAVAGYGLLLSWRQEPLPHLPGHDLQPPPAVDASLPHLPEVRDALAVEAAVTRTPATPARLRVQVVGDLPPLAKGVGVFDDRTGSLQAWLELRDHGAEGQVIAGEHTICLADSAANARRSYLARGHCRVRADQDNRMDLPAAVHTVHIDLQLDDHRGHAGLALLRRDDPEWRLADGKALRPASSGSIALLLPAGDYQLALLGGDAAPVAFTVPAAANVSADFRR